MGAYSFHHTKNLISGEGGALCINNPIYDDLACNYRDKGTNRRQFFRGEVDKYTWVSPGSSLAEAPSQQSVRPEQIGDGLRHPLHCYRGTNRGKLPLTLPLRTWPTP